MSKTPVAKVHLASRVPPWLTGFAPRPFFAKRWAWWVRAYMWPAWCRVYRLARRVPGLRRPH